MEYTTSLAVEYATGESRTDAGQTFEEYMQETHMLDNPTILDDELPDDFDRWKEDLTRIDVTKYAVEWGATCPFLVSKEYCDSQGIE